MTETYLSVCDGIGGACEAWSGIGWKPAMLSEIEPWPRALLEQRQGAVDIAQWTVGSGTPLWGDFSAIRIRHLLRFGVALPSMLVGGTPCQAFSVAGLRKSLDDARGNLTLSFVKLADALDNARSVRGLPPIIIVWENVPGVLSTKDNAFGCFLAALVGSDAPLVPGRGQKWTNAGMVVGPRRKAAWRVVDAQFWGVAQRRRRVFVVSSAREGLDPSEILFESNGMLRDPPTRGSAGERPAAGASPRSGGVGGEAGRVVAADAGGAGDRGVDGGGRGVEQTYVGNAEGGATDLPFLTVSNLGKTVNNQTPLIGVECEPIVDGCHELAPALTAGARGTSRTGETRGQDPVVAVSVEAFPINNDALRGEGAALTPSADATGRVRLRPPGFGVGESGDPAGTVTAGGPGAVAVVEAFSTSGAGYWREGVGALRARDQDSHENLVTEAMAFKPSHYTRDKDGAPSTVFPPLSADADRGDQEAVVFVNTISQPLAYNLSPGAGSDGVPSAVETEVANALTTVGEADKNGRGLHIVEVLPFDTTQITSTSNYSQPKPGDPCHPLAAGAHPPTIAYAMQAGVTRQNIASGPDGAGVSEEQAYTLEARPEVQIVAFAVRGREEGAVPEVEGGGDTVGTLRSASGGSSRDFVAMAFDVKRGLAPHGAAVETELVQSLAASDHKDPPLVRVDDVAAFTVSQQSGGFAWEGDVHSTLDTSLQSGGNQRSGVRVEAAVRRLTPTECERLQGYRDGYTLIAWRGKPPEECPDGPRYRALGNSWAVPCVHWIGLRIQAEVIRSGAGANDGAPGVLWGANGPVEYRLAA